VKGNLLHGIFVVCIHTKEFSWIICPTSSCSSWEFCPRFAKIWW